MASLQTSSSDRIRKNAAWVSTLASMVILLIKLMAYRLTGSTAVLSDALESIVNVVAAVVALFLIRLSMQPADENHPYGHGKAENFSSTFEGGMILFAAIVIIAQSVKALINQEPAHQLEMGLLLVSAASILNLFLGLYLKAIGKKHHSEALQASGTHVLTDVVTTVGVIVGLGLVLLTGLQWLDPVVAILVGLQLAYSGFKIVRGSLGILMDEQDETVVAFLAAAMQKNRSSGIIDIHQLRTIRSGRFHHVDAHMVVPEYWDVSRVHELGNRFEEKVFRDYSFEGEVAFHVDPCKKSFCEICSIPDCPVRQVSFKSEREFTVKSLTAGPHPTN